MLTAHSEKTRVAERIFADLKNQIISGGLHRGARLPTEKSMSQHYGVSGPTIREAIRGLSVLGLVDVRHGSGAYVSADGEGLVAMSLAAVMQLETVGIVDALGLLSVLNGHAANLATRNATASDLRRLRETTKALENVGDDDSAARAVQAFHDALAKAAHNSLLEVICSFLAHLQVAFALQVTQGSIDAWRTILDGLAPSREALVMAIERRDSRAAGAAAAEFHRSAIQLITSLPRASEIQLAEPDTALLMESVLSRMAGRTPLPELG